MLAAFSREDALDDAVAMRANTAAMGGESNHELHFLAGRVEIHAPVVLDNEVVGSISIFSYLQQMYSLLGSFVGIALLVMIMSLTTAWLLSQRLQAIISQPVMQLLGTIQTVTASKDYSVRAPKRRHDELGSVIDGFNAMLVTGAKVRATFHFRDSQGFRILIRSGHGRMFTRY